MEAEIDKRFIYIENRVDRLEQWKDTEMKPDMAELKSVNIEQTIQISRLGKMVEVWLEATRGEKSTTRWLLFLITGAVISEILIRLFV